MRLDGIPTLTMSTLLRSSISSSQRSLANAQIEASTSRYADIGLALGANTGRDVALRNEMAELGQIKDANGLLSSRATVTQDALSQMQTIANNFIETLTGAQSATNGQALAQQAAEGALAQITSLLNTTQNGQYIFGGLNSGTAPLADYDGSSAQAAVNTAFQASFGVTPDDAGVSAISSTDMSAFLDGSFAELFGQSSWETSWTAASSDLAQARINSTQHASVDSSATALPFRQLVSALTMVAGLGAPNLSAGAFDAIAQKALSVSAEAAGSLGAEQSRVGLAQNAVSNATDAITSRINSLTKAVQKMEGVDPYDAATRVNTLMTQLEASYSLTARISNLSLLNEL
ncbi:flagellar hook-associated family protein [Aestuariivirga sp.]|uniref:flagellar hook-associated family protein n=1 Tax=Aestuariivirga sp. TaxID=2650926 RepID=UPI0039E32659